MVSSSNGQETRFSILQSGFDPRWHHHKNTPLFQWTEYKATNFETGVRIAYGVPSAIVAQRQSDRSISDRPSVRI